MQFHDLGLLVVDEEQRFGVRHKERLKQLRHNVDSIAMSATPIPRTLHMSLLGLRDLSVIETPPKDRLSIHTVVAHNEDDIVRAALEQELARGGQVYVIHNRVETVFAQAARIRGLMPGARVGVGHGQMADAELEKVILGFMRHEFDVLVSTSIVEDGLDIPAANTIVIENADRFGLSELYQLRGRVGRSNRRAYAYLLVPPNGLYPILQEAAGRAERVFRPGAGFKIAALDLELRGAGNLLGRAARTYRRDRLRRLYVDAGRDGARDAGRRRASRDSSAINLGLKRASRQVMWRMSISACAYKKIADIRHPADAASDGRLAARRARELEQLAEFSLCKSIAKELGVETLEKRGSFCK